MPTVRRQRPAKSLKKTSAKPKSTGSMLARAEEVSFDKNDPFSMAIFGAPTTGKTTITSTFPKPILMLTCSGNLKKPGELRSIPKNVRKSIKQLVIEDCEQLPKVCEELRESDEFKTVSLDNLTSFSDLVLAQVLGIDRTKPQLAWGDVQQAQWQRHGSLVKSMLRDFIELPMFSTIVCHERLFEPKEGTELGVSKLGPAVTPTIANYLVGALDFIVQTFIREQTIMKTVKVNGKSVEKERKTGETEFCAYLPMAEDRMTKFRKPRGATLDRVLVDPTFERLIAIMED